MDSPVALPIAFAILLTGVACLISMIIRLRSEPVWLKVGYKGLPLAKWTKAPFLRHRNGSLFLDRSIELLVLQTTHVEELLIRHPEANASLKARLDKPFTVDPGESLVIDVIEC
jgi:hypothetical protein